MWKKSVTLRAFRAREKNRPRRQRDKRLPAAAPGFAAERLPGHDTELYEQVMLLAACN